MGAGIPDLSNVGDITDYLSQGAEAGADVATSAIPYPNPLMIWNVLSMIPGLGIPSPMDLIMGMFSGVPKGAKTAGAASTLEGEGGVPGELGKGILDLEGGKGSNVLSNPAFAHQANTLADELTWLSGNNIPGWKPMGSTGEIAGIKPPSGAPYGKPVNIMGVQGEDQLAAQLGKSPNLSAQQIQEILPQLVALSKQPGMTIEGLKAKLPQLIKQIGTHPIGPLGGGDFGGGGGGGGKPLEINPFSLLGGGGLGGMVRQFLSQNSDQQGLQFPLGGGMGGFDTHVNPGAFPLPDKEIQF